ncbi:MAG: O-antigen ligase family protein [Patescibacteria group bacterium]
MKSIFRQGILVGLFAVLFIPFIVVNGFFFPFITGKAFAFRIIVEVVFALWVVLAFIDSSVRPKASALLYVLLAFVVSIGISTVLAENPSKAFWSNFERMEGYITILHLGAYFVVVNVMLQGEKLWKRFLITTIGVSALVGLYGVLQLGGVLTINQGGVRVDATLGNATYLAVYMLFHVFFALLAFAKWKWHKWAQVFLGFALVLQVLMVFYTATRGTILGLIGGLLVSGLVFAFFQKGNALLRKAGIALVAGVLVVSGGFFILKDSAVVQQNDVLSRIASISLSEGETRFAIWGMAIKGFQERPVFGWGQEGFNYVFNTHYDPSLYAQEPWFDRAHNVFFDWLVAGGLVGLVLYLTLSVCTLWYLWKPGSVFGVEERALLTGLLAGYSFHNLFVFDNLISYIFFFTVLAYVVSRHTEGKPTLYAATQYSPSTVQTVGALTLVVFLGVFYVANIPGIARASGLINALKPYEEGITRNFEEYKKVIGPSGVGRQEVHEQLIQFATQIRSQNLLHLSNDAFRGEVALFARDALKTELARTPNDARLQVFYGSFLRQIGDREGSVVELEKARALSPKKQNIIFEQGVMALEDGNQQAALNFFKEAFELEPNYDRARILYAAAALRSGERALGESLLQEGFGTLTPDDGVILQTYIDLKLTDRVVAIAEERVRKDPDNFQTHLQLAAAYVDNGERVKAVASLREAMRLNPDFAAQGEYYIGEIEAGRNP